MNLSDVLTGPRLFVEHWAGKRKRVSATDLSTYILDYEAQLREFNYANKLSDIRPLKGIQRNLLEAAFDEYLNKMPDRIRVQLAETLVCSNENLEPLKQWVNSVTGSVNNDDLYVMAHWIWLVKRNALQLPVIHHIMPIITSPKQGGGKSTAVKNLLRPIDDLTLELKVPQVVDERSFTMFSNYLIGFFDEMAGAEKVEISDFKRNVTSSSLTYRPMRTNVQVKINNICSFIGATNNDLFEIIKDTTGIRRFFPINAMEKLNHEGINSIDYLALWQGVDERLDRGYFERVQDTVVAKQEDMQMKDEVILFLEDYNVIPEDPKKTDVIPGKVLYDEYVFHTKNAGIRFQVSSQTFYKKLKTAGLQGAQKRNERKVKAWYFAVNPNIATLLKGTPGDI